MHPSALPLGMCMFQPCGFHTDNPMQVTKGCSCQHLLETYFQFYNIIINE